MEIKVDGIDHIYLTVGQLAESEVFYDRLMSVLGFRKVKRPLAGGDFHVHYFNRVTQVTLRPARSNVSHDPYAPGLHHLCLRVSGKANVDEAVARLETLGLHPSDPRLYPEYAPDYYATFLTDPDGIRLEITNHRAGRREIVDEWQTFAKIEPEEP